MSTERRTWSYQAAGSACVYCRYRPARPSSKFPERSTLYCSDRCREIAGRHRDSDRMRAEANAIRRLMNLGDAGGPHFTAPELEQLRKHLDRLTAGYGGSFHLPARVKNDGRRRRWRDLAPDVAGRAGPVAYGSGSISPQEVSS